MALPASNSTRFYAFFKPNATDAAGRGVLSSIKDDLGLEVSSVKVADVYAVHGIPLSASDKEKLAKFLFSDVVVQDYSVDKEPFSKKDGDWLLEVGFKKGVTDNVGNTALIGMADVLGRPLPRGAAVRMSRQYCVKGKISQKDAERICFGLLANSVIQDYSAKKL
ncbi:MAG: hypothetical protein WC792_01145 [Candidatus Micrarchaeia archaeon]|jgi:phosphoribosylformylglycinamidine synthase